MAVQTDQQRQDGWADLMQQTPTGVTYAITKLDLRAAYNALDQWLSDNAATINAAIPQPARGALSASEKARLFAKVIHDRYTKGV